MNTSGLLPTTLNLMVNDVCNSRCKMCRVWKQKAEREITPEELSTILRDQLFSNLRYVGISGGEPTIRRDLPEMFRVIAGKEGLRGTGLITNALVAEHVIKQVTRCNEVCVDANLPYNVMISLDGIGKVHDTIRGQKGSFENALKVIRYLRDNTHIPLSVGCTVIKQNVWHLDEVLDFCKKENVHGKFRVGEFINRLYNNDLKTCIRNFSIDERYQIALFFSKLELSYEASPNVKGTYRNIRQMIFEGKPRESGCPYQLEALGLDSRGNLLFCSPKSPILGSCLEKSAKIIFEKSKPLRESIIQRYCSNCIHDYDAAPSKESLGESAQTELLRTTMSVRQSIKNSTSLPTVVPAPLQWSRFKKVLIVGWYGTETVGDKAIISEIIRRLKNSNRKIQITVASLYPFITRRTFDEIGAENIRIVKTYSIDYIETCQSVDAVVMGGGPLMGMEPLGFVLTAFAEARKANIPCIIEGCGIGPLMADEHILAVKEILRLSAQIRVRDKTSLSWVIENTGRVDAICTGDPAASFVEEWKKETLPDQKIHDEVYFACFLREITFEYANGESLVNFLEFRERFEKELGMLVCNIREKTGLKPLLMPMHTFAIGQDDRDFARRFGKTYLQDGDYDIGNKVYSPQDILSVMSRSKFNVCMRFHSILFAEKLDVPFVAIDYTGGGKNKGFLKDQNKLEFMFDRSDIRNKNWRQKIDNILLRHNLRSMSVVHLCSQDFGGAGKAAYRLHKGLQTIGVNSTMLVLNKRSGDTSVKVLPIDYAGSTATASDVPVYNSPLWMQQLRKWHKLLLNYPKRPAGLEMFTDAESDIRIDLVQEIRDADIINLHWVAGEMDYPSASTALGNKPVVWTLHDMNPFTGGCHYAGDCLNYKTSCGACPQLGSDTENDLSNHVWKQKYDVYKALTINIVSPSRWLGKCAAESKLFSPFPVTVIPNGFPIDIFMPYPKAEVRKELNIPESAKVILFGAESVVNIRKGFIYLLEALNRHSLKNIKDSVILTFGSLPEGVKITSRCPVYNLGRIADENQLALAYSAADVFVIPSLEDNLPNTVVEAMACGVPVVGFDIGGIPDLVDHKKTGFLVRPRNIAGLIEGIDGVISSSDSGTNFSEQCRKKVEKEYALEVQAKAYYELYSGILQDYLPLEEDIRARAGKFNQQGEDFFKKGDLEGALNAFTRAIEIHPDYATTHNNLGVLYYNRGEKDKALNHYQQAAQLQPENITFQKNLADFYYVEMGQVEKAMQIYVQVLNANPEDIETLLVLAHICVALEKFDDAKDFYNRVLKIDPGNKDAREFLEKLEKWQLSVASGQTDQTNNEADSNGYLISAIVSTYNSERFMRGCLEDLENQTIADRLEIVVVNSSSQQNEEAVIREFQGKYPNIKYIKTDQRETVYAAWNRGIQAATGKYITNANTDDRHRKDALEVMVKILETLPDISLVYADVIITETENEKFEGCTPVGYFSWMNFSREDLLNKGCFMGPQPMWRKDVHHEYGYFDDSFVTSGDYEFWLRISQSCTFMHLPVQLGLYLRSPGSIEHSNREKQREENSKIFKMYKYAQSSGKIIRRLKTSLPQDRPEQSNENIKSLEEIYKNILAAVGNKQPEEIIEEIERLSVSFPKFALVHNDLGVLYYNDGDKEKALNHYQKAVELEPANVTFQKNLADFYFVELDRKEEALQIYLSLLNHHPNDLEMNLTAAHICVAVQNFSQAQELYKQVLVIDSENEDACNNLRTLDKMKGHLRTDQQPKTESLQINTSEEYSPVEETIGVKDAPEKDIPQFSIIMTTSAPLKQFRRCVESIKKQTSESHEILFVNNGTTKGVLKWIRQCIDENHNCRLVKCGKGANPAVCHNTGIKAARGGYIVLLSNDVVVTDGWLSSMLQCFSSIPDAGMVGTMANQARGRQKVAATVNTSFTEINTFAESYRTTNRYRRIVCDIPDGFCLLFRRDLTEKIGLFDEQMAVQGFEDEDYCLRAALEGYVNQIAGDVYLHRLERKAPARSRKNFNLKWSGADAQSLTGKRHLALKAVEKANRAGEEGKIDPAVELFLQAIGLLPERKEIYYKLAELLVNTKRFKDALDVLNELPEGDPDARHLALAACSKEGLELFEEAEGHADQALEINRCVPSALNTKGIIAFRRDDKNAAESYFIRAMETDPGFGEAYTNLGALKWAAGLKDEALSLYERGFILSPTVADIALNYHCALADLCEYQRAEIVVRDVAAVHPLNQKVRYMLIDILIHQHNHAMAMQEIETAMADFGVDDGILSSALKIREKIGPLTIDSKTGRGSTVSLCMIVKDEEAHLARCLQSVRPVVDEIIVVDTGSRDRSRDIARVFGAKVFDFEWTEDFAEARNYSLSKATGKMVFVMDADEVISPLDYELFRRTAGQLSRQRRAFIINTRNYTMDNNLVEWVPNEGYYDIEEAGTGWTPSAKIRLFPNDRHIRFNFPVHEMVEPSLQKMGIAMKVSKFQVHHYGKLNRDKSEKKGEAYYEIGCRKLEEMGDAPVALRELAIQAEGLKKHQESVELWERFIALVPNEPKAYINMGISYCSLGQFDKVLATAEKALKLAPDSKEGHFNCALAKLHLGHPSQAIEILEKMCNIMPEYLPARFILAAACCCRGDKKRGMALLKELSATAIGPGLAIRCHELASRFVFLQRSAYALALLDAAIDSQNGNKDVLDLYADCLKHTDFHKKTGTYE